MVRIAILDDYQGVALSSADWSAVASQAEITVFREPFPDAEAVIDSLRGFDIVCAMRERTRFSRTVLERLPGLKLIASTAERNAAIDEAAAAELGIAVAHTRGVGNGTPELTWALILGARRHLAAEAASLRAGGWQTGVGGDLNGRTLGVLGLGKVGSAVARVALAFDMTVIAWSAHLDPGHARSLGVEPVAKEDLFRRADIVTLHMVLSERTKGIVGADDLGLMKPDALLVNTSRGPLIDEAALIAALEDRRIGGAALDTFDEEPLPADHPFRRLPNVLATPHIGYVTADTYRLFYQGTVDNILAWMARR